MPETLQLGPLLLNGVVLSYVIAALCGYALLVLRLRLAGEQKHPLPDIVGTSLVIVVLFWKFGFVLFDISMIWERPQMLLFTAGAARELALGAIAALLYAAFRLSRLRIPPRLALDYVIFGLLAYWFVKNILIADYGDPTDLPWGVSPAVTAIKFHPLHWYRALWALPVLIWLWTRNAEPGTGYYAGRGLIFMGAGMFLVSLFHRSGQVIGFFQLDQWAAILIALVGYVVLRQGIIKHE